MHLGPPHARNLEILIFQGHLFGVLNKFGTARFIVDSSYYESGVDDDDMEDDDLDYLEELDGEEVEYWGPGSP